MGEEPSSDSEGRTFFSFAVDARHGFVRSDTDGEAGWRIGAITGCVYPDSGKVYVRQGDAYRPAALLLGKKSPAAAAHATS